jgi:hypothetical protein
MSISRLFTAILFVALFVMTVRELSDPDVWWHLRAGQYILEHSTVPHTDPFSFTAQGKEWVAHEWLSEVFLYGIYRLGGFSLLTLVFSALITLALGLVYLNSSGRPYLAGFALLLGALAMAPTWGVRPQMLSLFLTSLFLFLLDRYAATESYRWVLALPILVLLWVNLHSGYAVGLVVIGIYCADAVLGRLVYFWRTRQPGVDLPKLPPPRISAHATRVLVLVLLVSLPAVLVNPNGARMVSYPFETLTSPAMQKYIQEWFSPDFHQLEWLPFALLVMATLAAALLGRARVPLAHTLLLVGLGLAGLRSARNIPLFAVVAVPVLGAQLASWIPLRAPKAPGPRLVRLGNLVLLGLVVLAALARIAVVLSDQVASEQANFPAAAVQWIKKNHPAPNLYNSYGWGGYLIWQLYPDYRVYIDGRADVYGDTLIEEFLNVYRASPGWQNELTRRDVRLVLIEPDAPLAQALSASPDWQVAFADLSSVIYRRK